jgi:hypothetical protein
MPHTMLVAAAIALCLFPSELDPNPFAQGAELTIPGRKFSVLASGSLNPRRSTSTRWACTREKSTFSA